MQQPNAYPNGIPNNNGYPNMQPNMQGQPLPLTVLQMAKASTGFRACFISIILLIVAIIVLSIAGTNSSTYY